MRACRREPVPHTPVWLMRQAGRYEPEYRKIRERASILEICRSPDLVSEVTVGAARRTGADAAILFADLLLIVEPMGMRLEFTPGEGPALTPAVRSAADVDRLREVEPGSLAYVIEGVRRTRADLPAALPLLGFCGAPFTVGSYMIEGGPSKRFLRTKSFMYGDEGAWRSLMEKLARGLAGYLNGQIEAGAQAVQVFDSWVGCLSPADYARYVRPYTEQLMADIRPGVPVIHFGTGTAALLEQMRAAGGSVIGLDWCVDPADAWKRIGYDAAIMGNLDPVTLLGPEEVMEREVRRILAAVAGRDGHVFNLGHGVLPETDPARVRRLVERVHELSRRPEARS
jgi:uroporphyrinogen decarboxylase